ncbi:MAG: FAD-dependent oxidoreductase [Coprobacillus sp.]|nr:FAD-dependent oxidoreductase [Coprobacillus sp.]
MQFDLDLELMKSDENAPDSDVLDCLIIGAGPGGINAAITLHKAGLRFLIFECDMPGGKVNIAPEVDNFPGYRNISGPDLAMNFYQDLLNEGIKINYEEVNCLEKEDDGTFEVTTNKTKYHSKSVIIASGTKNNLIGLDKEQELLGHGISYCSLCDGHFFKGENVLVVGGGNVALKEAIHLSSIVGHLYVVHRRNEFRGEERLVGTLKEKENVTILTPYIATEILGTSEVEGVRIKNVETNEERVLDVKGFFPLVGQIPNTQFVLIPGVKDSTGFIPIDKNRESTCQGLFAIGDVTERTTRQIFIAYKDGEIAANTIISRLK